MADLKRRLEKLESVERAKEPTNRLKIETGYIRLKIETGYIQHLPAEYQGPRHLVVRDRLPWSGLGGCVYEWGELRGQRRRPTKRVELVGTEPYRLGDARRKREAEVQQNGVLQ
jgi:hypothetical protein